MRDFSVNDWNILLSGCEQGPVGRFSDGAVNNSLGEFGLLQCQ